MRRRGSIEELALADGTTVFRARLTRKGRKVLDRCFPTESLAAQAIELILSEDTLAPAPRKRTTLGELVEEWLMLREEQGFVRGIRKEWSSYRSKLAGHHIMKMPAKSVKRRHVKALVVDLLSAPSSPSSQTVKHALRLVRGALSWAVEEERLPSNPASGVKVPRKSAPRQWTFLSRHEVQALIEAPIPTKQRTLFLLALFTGLRKGELLGLRWEDADLEDRHPRVVVRASNGGPTKNMRVREVPLIGPAVRLLRQYKAEYPGLPKAHVFRRRSGGRHDQNYDGGWRRDWASRVLGRHVRFHDLRHSCASCLISGDWAPHWVARPLRMEEVQKWLGHSSITVTHRYAHLSPESLRAVVTTTLDPAAGLGSSRTRRAERPTSHAPTLSHLSNHRQD